METRYQSLKTTCSFLLLFVALLGASCSDKCEETNHFVYYEPVYSTSAQIKAAVKLEAAQPLSQIGRIYFKDGILFINEAGEGIHIIDNHNPAAPENKSFLTIPGNFDLSIRGNTLYADSYTDLVAFDISDLTKIREVSRIENLFNNHVTLGRLMSSERGILTNWERKETEMVEAKECDILYQPWGGFYHNDGIALARSTANTFNAQTAIAPGSGTGIGGSMARFTVVGDHLYGLDGANLDIVDITNQSKPVGIREYGMTWDIETLFPHEDKLFVGSQSGMYILDVSAPTQPTQLSQYSHVRSCDPVVVEGDYAYVTLRSGTACQGFTNQLEVINIANLQSPSLVKTYPMTNPHGLGIDQGTLFICDGDAGLKVYNATNVNTIDANQLAHYSTIRAFDIIPYQHVAMMIGQDGLYQYDYSDINNIKLLSSLPIVEQ